MGYASTLAAIKVGPFRYNSPWAQVAIVGFVCFCSPGLFNALSGLGAGGTVSFGLNAIANSVLYAMFSLTGELAVLGPRLTLCLGTVGYSVYVGSLWAFQVHPNAAPFWVVAGGILGVCAALLWTAAGQIMMSYPTEKDKGRSFSLFWSVFSMGGVIGGVIALGVQLASGGTHKNASTSVYIVFLVLMLTAIFTAWLVLPPNYVVRKDGTLVDLEESIPVGVEIREFVKLFKDWRMLALFPMFFASNFFYAYQGSVVGFMFNARTRALSSFITNLGAVVGANFVGFLLDYLPFGRRKRTVVGWVLTLVLLCVVWGGGGLSFQQKYQNLFVRDKENPPTMAWDWTDHESRTALALMFGYYFTDSVFQGLAYYIMATLTNDPFKLARMTGYYKGVQSAGAAVSFAMEAVYTPYRTELLVSWLLMVVSLPLALVVIIKTPDTNVDKEQVVHVEDLNADQLHHAALPKGHHEKDIVDEEKVVEANLDK
ncbi:hypothetical protein Q8F55_007669 [Vanrija albida]|uniref:Major facilitator superfamily (MFS) profile domain-containing protein n=1 Tax=Vanrija albida TaxID=181172 RepID=A0ABR3PU64_9TREE